MLDPTSLLRQFNDLQIPAYPSVTGLSQPIAIQSLVRFLLACGWLWAVIVACTGWGRATGKIARLPRLPASISCALGIASLAFLGGLLNLVHGLYAGTLLALILVGLAFYLFFYRERPPEYGWRAFWRRSSIGVRILCGVALLILLLRAAGTVRLDLFNNIDDGPAYLVFSHKLIANHAFAFDPFSDRRLISSLGGAYLLQAFVIVATSLSHIAMADRTFGMVLLAAALFDLGIACELALWQISLLEFLAFLVPQQTINLTFVVLPTSLLIAMVWTVLRAASVEGPSRTRYALLAGAIGGMVISLKSTFLPCVGAFALIPFLFLLPHRKGRGALRLAILAGLACLVVLAPWMIAMRRDSGTFLFPLFGRGVDYASYHLLPGAAKFTSTRKLIKVFLQAIPLVILLCVQIFSGEKGRRVRLSMGVLIASAVAITAFNYESGADFIWRYNFPQFFVAILVFYAAAAYAIRNPAAGKRVRIVFYCAVAALGAMVFYYDVAGAQPQPFREVRLDGRDYRHGLRASLTGKALSSPGIVAEYRDVEQTLPPGSRAIENTAYPFLFSYRGRTIFLADWPGAASPKPGWPFGANLNPLVRYLRQQSIQYLVYDYRYANWIDMEGCQALEAPDRNSQELLALWRIAVVTHNQFDGLRSRYRSIYDDGKIAVIDLNSPRADAPAARPVWTLDTSKEEMCSSVLARYQAHPLPAQNR